MYHVMIIFKNKYNRRAKRTEDEILSDAALIMIRCIELFNLDLGFRFTTYYYNSCYRSMMQDLRRIDRGRLPTISVNDNLHGEQVFSGKSTGVAGIDCDSQDSIAALFSVLDERESAIMRMRWIDEMTMKDVGKAIGVSRQRIMQIEERAFKKIRASLGLNEFGGER